MDSATVHRLEQDADPIPPLVVVRFDTAFSAGPAIGPMQKVTWNDLARELSNRREGGKDGASLVFARFKPEPEGSARRLKEYVLARTAVALDCETNKRTGEVPPPLGVAVRRAQTQGWGAILYTSHNHTLTAPRYRILLPLSAELPPDLPAVEVVAASLGLDGVLDRSKLGAASLFYLPSAKPGCMADHETITTSGTAIDAAWIRERAGALLATREAAQARQRLEAMATAEARRAAKIAAGLKPSENLIESIRGRLDLEAELLRHGYTQVANKFLYPGSETGVPGVHIMTSNDGVQRVYSHHATDPLAAGNLPSWCAVKAVDVVDVVTILDFGGDQKKALHHLAQRFAVESKLKPSPDHNHPAWEAMPTPDNHQAQSMRPGELSPASNDQPWPEPVDFLANENHTAPTLRADHIPAALWPFVTDTAARMGADPAAVALASLVSCAAVICDDWALQPKRFDTTWTECARLWGAIVGEPSILKTPVLSAATKPIDKLEADARERHKTAMRQWREDEAQAKVNKTVPPPQPRMDRYMVEGSTPEALSEVLRDDDEARMHAPAKKILSRHDEMSEFFGGLDRYKAGGKGGSERGAYLRLYNGGRYTIDRVGRGSFAVPNWSACFLGGVQPGPIQRIARDAAEDGLLQRFIYCVPGAQRQGIDREPDHVALARYSALFPALVAMKPSRVTASGNNQQVVFHADAHQHREAIDNLARVLGAMPDTTARLQASLGKWPGLFARLCLTFHLIDIADRRARGEPTPPLHIIAEATARQVADYMREIILPHMMRADSIMFATDQTGHARWIAGFILAQQSERITTRDIVASYRALRAPEARRELETVMASLVAVSWLDPVEPTSPTKGVTTWRVNPAVHVQYAQRAAGEAARRAQVRKQLETVFAAAKAGRSVAT
jgi:hypothetical protein